MGYMHIENLYKNRSVLSYDRVWAMEKIHGTSAHIMWRNGLLTFFSGGVKHDEFVKIFDHDYLEEQFHLMGNDVVIYSEAYGGKCQKMSDTYGKELRFVAFDVKIISESGDIWLDVGHAHCLCLNLDIEFVDCRIVEATVENLDAERDRPSTQAMRNGMGDDKVREGIVIRPLVEAADHRGNRIIAKHKIAQFRETATNREVDVDKLVILEQAEAVAKEWVTPMRLEHVLDRFSNDLDARTLKLIPQIIRAMLEDVKRESEGEVVWSKDVERCIGRRTAYLTKELFTKVFYV